MLACAAGRTVASAGGIDAAEQPEEAQEYQDAMENSWVYKELRVRQRIVAPATAPPDPPPPTHTHTALIRRRSATATKHSSLASCPALPTLAWQPTC